MLHSLQGLGSKGYGILYTVPFTYLYLLSIDASVSLPFLGTVESPVVLGGLFLLSLYGAIWIHRVALLLYGDSAGIYSSASKQATRAHAVYFMTLVDPSDLPNTTSRVSLVRQAGKEGISWPVFARAFPGALYYAYLFVGWLFLTSLFIGAGVTIIGRVLWIVLTFLLFESWVVGYLPSYIPPESVHGIDKPAYINRREEIQQERGADRSTRRINPKHRRDHGISIRSARKSGFRRSPTGRQ